MPTSNTPGLLLYPQAMVVPVASEVVLLAAVRGPDQYLRTNERIEWTLDPCGVGQFLDLDRGSWMNYLVGDFTRPTIFDAHHALASTSRTTVRLTRGTPSPEDDILVLSGQTWISLTSLVEGTSFVTATAPRVAPGERNQQSAVVHWIDAQWSFPPPAIVPAGGRHVFTTTVTRLSNQAPRENVVVRYEIVEGPPAGFAPEGAPAIEVLTGFNGQASAEIFQKQPLPGTNRIAMEIVRPPLPGGAPDRVVIGRGAVLITWSAPYAAPPAVPTPAPPARPAPTPAPPATATIDVRLSGPERATVGDKVEFEILITNRSAVQADNLLVRDNFDPGLVQVDEQGRPHEELRGRIERELGNLGSWQSRRIGIGFLVVSPGRQCHAVEVSGAAGVCASARVCMTVLTRSAEQPSIQPPIKPNAPAPLQPPVQPPVEPGKLGLKVAAPPISAAGEVLLATIEVTNTGKRALSNVKVTAAAEPPIKVTDVALGAKKTAEGAFAWTIPSLPPGERRQFSIKATGAKAAARACIRASAVAEEGASAEETACLEIRPEKPAPTPPKSNLAAVVESLRNPVAQGKEFTYRIQIRNNGAAPDRQVTLTVTVPRELVPVRLGTYGPTAAEFSGQTIRFAPIGELAPGQTAEYRVRVRAQGAGEVALQARVQAENLRLPLIEEAKTLIFLEK